MTDAPVAPDRLRAITGSFGTLAPGLLAAATAAVAAQFLSDHYGAPAMLMALLLGMAFNFLSEEGRCVAGIALSSRSVLRLGVALLGVRISVDLVIGLGWPVIVLLAGAVVATILFGLLAARLFGRSWRLALLTGGAVAICGASAAMAIAAVLPKNEFSERNLIFTVLGVTVLSTIAMIAYPMVVHLAGLDDRLAGIFLGGTIHDVAQVVGAGFSVSQETGEVATLVKLLRVTLLAPVVLVLSLAFRRHHGVGETSGRPPILPLFVAAFILLAALNSLGFVPPPVASLASDLSRWALLMGIVAVGMKTSLKRMLDVGGDAIAVIVAETLFIAAFILLGLHFLTGVR